MNPKLPMGFLGRIPFNGVYKGSIVDYSKDIGHRSLDDLNRVLGYVVL